MWAEVKRVVQSLFETYPKRKVGFLLGVIFALSVLIFGFFNTFFAVLCGVIGLYIGSRFEEGDELLNNTIDSIEKNVPRRFKKYFN